jgi:hypothetical protein
VISATWVVVVIAWITGKPPPIIEDLPIIEDHPIRVAKPPDLARSLLVFRPFSWLKNLLVPGAGFRHFLLVSPGF